MSRVNKSLDQALQANDFLLYGMQNELLNLKQVARFLQASISESLGRAMSVEAVHMALSRWKSQQASGSTSFPKTNIFQRLFVHNDLCVVSFPKTAEVHEQIGHLLGRINDEEGYFSMTQGTSEITSIFDKSYLRDLKELVSTRPRRIHNDACGVGLRFKKEFLDTPGLIYKTLEQIYLKQISMIELSSTHSELNLYVRPEDARKAMDVLYYKFVEK